MLGDGSIKLTKFDFVSIQQGSGEPIAHNNIDGGLSTDKFYVAPEVKDNEMYASKKAEVFNLGMVLYHLVCG